MFVLFCFIMLTRGLVEFVAFAPVLVMICLALGLDSITAVAIMTGGTACGFATGMLQPSTTLIAQELAGLPPFSGIEFRALCFVLYTIGHRLPGRHDLVLALGGLLRPVRRHLLDPLRPSGCAPPGLIPPSDGAGPPAPPVVGPPRRGAATADHRREEPRMTTKDHR